MCGSLGSCVMLESFISVAAASCNLTCQRLICFRPTGNVGQLNHSSWWAFLFFFYFFPRPSSKIEEKWFFHHLSFFFPIVYRGEESRGGGNIRAIGSQPRDNYCYLVYLSHENILHVHKQKRREEFLPDWNWIAVIISAIWIESLLPYHYRHCESLLFSVSWKKEDALSVELMKYRFPRPHNVLHVSLHPIKSSAWVCLSPLEFDVESHVFNWKLITRRFIYPTQEERTVYFLLILLLFKIVEWRRSYIMINCAP